MGQVISFADYVPPARYDATPWSGVRIEEASDNGGPWSAIDTLTISPTDVDPSEPEARDFTTDQATATPGLWYRLTFTDSSGGESQPTDPVQQGAATGWYITESDLKESLQLTGETFANLDLNAAIAAASRMIDGLTGRRFYTTVTDEVRYFSPNRDAERTLITWGFSPVVRVPVGDLLSVTELATDPSGDATFTDVWTVDDDFFLEPFNATTDGKPYTYVARNPQGEFLFPSMPRSIRITGKFGWDDPPSDIVDACTILAGRLLKRKREAPFGLAGVGVDGAVARITSVDPDVRALLQPYMAAPFA